MMARNIEVLDVRDILRAKEEPFGRIMETLGTLKEDDVFELHATFEPLPLIKVLGRQGFQHAVIAEKSEHYIVQFYKETMGLPYFHLDNRNLEPPQPMIRTLEFLDRYEECQLGKLGLEIWNVRVPALLLPELDERGFTYVINDEENDIIRVQIHRDL